MRPHRRARRFDRGWVVSQVRIRIPHTSEERWREIEGVRSRALGRGDVRDRDGVQGRSGVRRFERGRQRLASY